MNEDKQNDFALYADMLHLPHHVSSKHAPMSIYNRAAQFSPFAALVGYDAEVAEAGRMTDAEMELDESEKARIDQKLSLIAEAIDRGYKPVISITYFEPDSKKTGGKYTIFKGVVKRVDSIGRKILFYEGNIAGKEIPVERIYDVRGELVDHLDDAVL